MFHQTTDYFCEQYNDLAVHERLGPDPMKLICFVVGQDQKVMTIDTLVELHGSETKLKGGRFHLYDPTVRDYPVSVLCETNKLKDAFTNILDWIANNGEGAWGFHLGKLESRSKITLFFENDCDALLYRLSIRGEVV